jgi:hypothetical protein
LSFGLKKEKKKTSKKISKIYKIWNLWISKLSFPKEKERSKGRSVFRMDKKYTFIEPDLLQIKKDLQSLQKEFLDFESSFENSIISENGGRILYFDNRIIFVLLLEPNLQLCCRIENLFRNFIHIFVGIQNEIVYDPEDHKFSAKNNSFVDSEGVDTTYLEEDGTFFSSL